MHGAADAAHAGILLAGDRSGQVHDCAIKCRYLVRRHFYPITVLHTATAGAWCKSAPTGWRAAAARGAERHYLPDRGRRWTDGSTQPLDALTAPQSNLIG